MARLPGVLFAVTAVLGLSGCLLFTDPINRAPTVTFVDHPQPVVRGETTEFWVTVSDDRDSPSSLMVRWGAFDARDGGCSWVTSSVTSSSFKSMFLSVSESRSADAPYELTAGNLDVMCLCVLAVDHDNASTVACRRIAPVNPAPAIDDATGTTSGKNRGLCSNVHLSAERAVYDTKNTLELDWTMDYSGSDPTGAKSVQLAECSGVPSEKKDQHRCFYANVPGTYTVSLTISEIATGGSRTTSAPGTFVVVVDPDHPPCILQTKPDINSQLIIMSRNGDLGGSSDSRTFEVLDVADDCEPLPATSPKKPAHFLWSINDSSRTPRGWSYSTNTGSSFTIDEAMFQNARPGDSIELRVEARDSVVDQHGAGATCDSEVVICCGGAACAGSSGCVRWTTWTVQFQP